MTAEIVSSNIIPLQHFSHCRIELFTTANVVETLEKIFGADACPLGPLQVVQHLTAVHHYYAITQMDCLLHGVCHHKGGEFVALNNVVREADYLVGALGVERGRVLI
jgi:hypothetical protein